MNWANRWALRECKGITKYIVMTVFDEVKNVISEGAPGRVVRTPADAYALVSRFKGTLYKHPFFKKKHIRILHSIVDRCGEAYYKKDPSILYISEMILREWASVFDIPWDRIESFIRPLKIFGILIRSDRPEYVYKVSSTFFNLVGPVAQYLVTPVDTSRFTEMMNVASGLASVYVIGVGTRERIQAPTIPWFLKLSMIYTFSGVRDTDKGIEIDGVLRLMRIDEVDRYFVLELEKPVELWRSLRAEAFEFMADNKIIEQSISDGYVLNKLWVRVHEEGVKRYVYMLRERYRGYR